MAKVRVAYQGERGAYGEEAVGAIFGPDAEAVPYPSFRGVFVAASAGQVDAGVVPIDNSLAGPVEVNYDLLLEHALPITGAVDLRIQHCLLALPGETLSGIRQVRSIQQALSQCGEFLRRHGMTPVPEVNTAASAKRLAEEKPPGTAVIASRRAAELYQLAILAEGIQDAPENYTRFFSLGGAPAAPGGRWKTSLVISPDDVPGALHRVLGAFAARSLNLTKLDSRPRKRGWEYFFFIDVEGAKDEPRVRAALEEAERACSFFRVLGSYRLR